MRQRPILFGAISLDLFAMFLGGTTALLPIFARDILHTGPWGLGFLRTAPAMGADLDVRPPGRDDRPGHNSGRAQVYEGEGGLFWRSYGWPGGQNGPCWRRWYGQWIWSC